jgi:hypothetical protein
MTRPVEVGLIIERRKGSPSYHRPVSDPTASVVGGWMGGDGGGCSVRFGGDCGGF